MKNSIKHALQPKNRSGKFLVASLIVFFLSCSYSSFPQQGCLYKYNSSDTRIFTQPKGVNKTYNDTPGPISNNPSGSTTAPAYNGSYISGYTIYSYGLNDCVTPNPSTRSSQPSNCVIWDSDSAMYPGYLVNYATNCDLDNYTYTMLLAFGFIGVILIKKQKAF